MNSCNMKTFKARGSAGQKKEDFARVGDAAGRAAHLAIPGRGVLFIESTRSHNWGLYLQLLWSFTKPRRAIGAFLSQSDVGT